MTNEILQNENTINSSGFHYHDHIIENNNDM